MHADNLSQIVRSAATGSSDPGRRMRWSVDRNLVAYRKHMHQSVTMPEVEQSRTRERTSRPGEERRRACRVQVDCPAYLNARSQDQARDLPLVACVIRDASSTGAMLSLDKSGVGGREGEGNDLPERLRLQIPSSGIEVWCAIVWRKPGRLGVRYISTARLLDDAARTNCCLAARGVADDGRRVACADAS
jgi:PilZ domain